MHAKSEFKHTSLENVIKQKYLGVVVTNQNCSHEEHIKFTEFLL
jgi:hypothetical protein